MDRPNWSHNISIRVLVFIIGDERDSLTLDQYFSSGSDKNAERVFYFDEGPRATTKLIRKLIQKRRRARPP
jgi:hypothetical protein